MTVDLGRGVLLYRRSEWGARPPRSRTGLTPSYGTTTHWEGPHMGAFPHSACAGKVRSIQAFHMDTRGWSDIAYTALTCPHGYAFEGRWVGTRTAANGTDHGNDVAYAVCYLGGEGDPFTPEAQRAQRATLDWLDAHGGAGPGRNCHRDWKATECPGTEICAWVRAGQPAPGPAPTPPKPPAPRPSFRAGGNQGMDTIMHQGAVHCFWVGHDGALCETWGDLRNPHDAPVVLLPAGSCKTGAEARVCTLDHAEGSEAFGYSVWALNAQGNGVHYLWWDGARWHKDPVGSQV